MKRPLDSRVKYFIKNISVINSMTPLPKTNRALRLVLKEMNASKGFARHDGQDYFVHMIAIAQAAIDFGLIYNRINNGKPKEADAILATCLLHDAKEDVPWVTSEYLTEQYGAGIATCVDNLTKRDSEDILSYLNRVRSNSISALVKILDRLNNVSTMSASTVEHRQKQLKETREYYLPLTKGLRRTYWEDSAFYWQARTILNALLNEVERCMKFEQ